MSKYFKISDFAQQVGKHTNTVDNWFKKLEDEHHIHYVTRIDNEKVYDELDLTIALYIRDKREEGWSLKAIFNELEDNFELRPLPEEVEKEKSPLDLDIIRRKFSEDMQEVIREAVASQVEIAVSEVKNHYDEILKQLPKPKDPLEERQHRITELITIERVKSKLRKEALHLWSTKPENERLKRTGLFRKEEDHSKRDLFVSEYIEENFESCLKQECGLP